MPASLLDMRLWRNSKNGHTHITLRLLPRDRGDLVRVGSFASLRRVARLRECPLCIQLATETVRRNEPTRMGWTGRAPAPNRSEDDRGLRSTRSTSPCPIRQPLQSLTPFIGIDT